MFETDIADGVLRVRRPGTRWLSTGWNGGFVEADAAYNISVPDGWDRTDVANYIDERRQRADFPDAGPTLLTGVALNHARGARTGKATVIATAGVSNPAALPMEPGPQESEPRPEEGFRAGTVNLIVGTTSELIEGALGTLLGVAVEAKAATLLDETGFPGTTTDAVVIGSDPDGPSADFAGSSTPIGSGVRVCVRDAVRASLRSRYAERELPASVDEAKYGVRTDESTDVFRL